MRTSGEQLPSYDELCKILSSEESRIITKEKENLHYADFSTVINLLNSFNLPTNFFTENIKFEEWKDLVLFEQVTSLFSNLAENIFNSKDDISKKELFNNLYDYLSEEDTLEKSDLIFVFGSKSTFRIEKAIELFNKGYAKKILVSGKCPFYEQDKVIKSEAEILAEFAIKQGVPKEVIIIEDRSITVPDNVKCSLNLLEKLNIPHKSIVLINSPFSQRRGWTHFQKFSDNDTKLFRSNTDKVSDQFSRDGWYKDKTGIKVILKEFFGLRVSELINTG